MKAKSGWRRNGLLEHWLVGPDGYLIAYVRRKTGGSVVWWWGTHTDSGVFVSSVPSDAIEHVQKIVERK